MQGMWKRKDMKRSGRGAIKYNYWRAVFVCLVLAVLAGSYAFTTQFDLNAFTNPQGGSFGMAAAEMAHEFMNGEEAAFATKGALSAITRSVVASDSIFMGIVNAVAQFVFGDSIGPGLVILAGTAVMGLYAVFVGNILIVGECRFYLENHKYKNTPAGRVLFIYKIRRTRHVAWVMAAYYIRLFLWALTIVGVFIKMYSYRMVPQILAENPNIKSRDAFWISRQMMRGNKWRAFVLDVSFWGWYILSSFTFGLVSILYVNPYVAATDARLYLHLRAAYLQRQPEMAVHLNDRLLDGPEIWDGAYPNEEFSIPEAASRRWLNVEYKRKYSIANIILIFFTFMLIGWLWEVAIELFGKGVFINRGTLHGPWLPLYGCGGVLSILLLRRWADNPVITYFVAFGVCGVLEYFAGWALEMLMGVRWWDYTGYFMNLHGRICLEGLIVFGLAGCVGVYVLGPILDDFYNRIPKRVKTPLCTALIVAFLGDLVYSYFNPNVGELITYSLDPTENEAMLKKYN